MEFESEEKYKDYLEAEEAERANAECAEAEQAAVAATQNQTEDWECCHWPTDARKLRAQLAALEQQNKKLEQELAEAKGYPDCEPDISKQECGVSCVELIRENKSLSEQLERANKDVEQLRVQLAGCSVAALGGTKEPAKQGDYGWSPAYADVLHSRQQLETWKRWAKEALQGQPEEESHD